MKILIADDHAIVRKGVIALLQAEFISVEIWEVSNGEEALNRIKENTWDIILLDISVPVRNGIETLRQLWSDGIKVPVLMLSMQPEDQYAIRALKEGASGFVNKACATDELVTAIRTVISEKKYISETLMNKLNKGD